MNEKTGNTKIAAAAFLAAVFAVTFTLTALTPLIADDFNYAFNWSYEDNLIRIDNYHLLWDSLLAHRYYTHGRILAEGLTSLFMMWQRWVFFAANALLLTLFTAALLHFFNRNSVQSPFRAAGCVLALYWICMPVFGQVFLWLNGACNYFWGAGFAFILLEAVFSLRQGTAKTLRMLLLLPLAFAVGSWSEHISFAALMILFLYLLSIWAQTKRIPPRETLVLLGGFGGYLFLMLAPSMLPTILKQRAIEASESHFQKISSLLASHTWLIPAALVILAVIIFLLVKLRDKRTRLMGITGMAFVMCFTGAVFFGVKDFADGGLYALISSTPVGFLVLLCVFLFAVWRALKQNLDKDVYWIPLILFFGGLSALIPFSVGLYIPARGFCAPVIFIGIAAVLLLEKTELSHRAAVCSCGAALFALLFLTGCADILRVHQAANMRDAAIRQALAGDGILTASPYPVKTKYSAQYGLLDLAEDENWPKDMIKEYYGLKEILVCSEG